MSNFSITAQKRTVTGKKVSNLRNQELVPATIYGPKIAPISVQFAYRELELILREAGSTNLISITVEDDKTYRVLARDVQRDIIRGNILHADFFAVDEESKIRVAIPVVLVGESPIVAARKAILVAGANTVRIECLPRDMVSKIEVDLSQLKTVGATIYIKDLPVPSGVTILNDGEEMVAKALQTGAQRAQAEQEAAAATGKA